jgi:ribose-phosphate pyrophosphokinase
MSDEVRTVVIDAGHGYAVLVDPVDGPRALSCEGGPPIGAVEGWRYDRSDVSWPVGARLVVFSDGVAEQLDADGKQLGLERIVEVLSRSETVEGDVAGHTCLIMDDIVDTAGTLTEAAKALKDRGAARVVAYCTHPVLSGPAIERLENSVIDELVVTDTIPLKPEAQACKKIRQIGTAELLAETIRRIAEGGSVSSLFTE